jgi:chromosome partitioning protein
MARKIAFTNQKGGVGKTTAALGLAGGLTRRGKRVLLVDLDAQGNASASLGLVIEGDGRTLKDLLLEGGNPSDHIVSTTEGDILPANNALKDIEPLLLRDDGVGRLKKMLAPLGRSYDFILFDCPPSINVFTRSALAAADEVIVPVEVGYFAVLGLKQLLEEIEGIRREHNRTLKLRGVLLSKYDRRTALSDQVLDMLREDLGERLLETAIRVNIDLVRAQIAQQSIFDYEPRSAGAEDFRSLTEEILHG